MPLQRLLHWSDRGLIQSLILIVAQIFSQSLQTLTCAMLHHVPPRICLISLGWLFPLVCDPEELHFSSNEEDHQLAKVVVTLPSQPSLTLLFSTSPKALPMLGLEKKGKWKRGPRLIQNGTTRESFWNIQFSTYDTLSHNNLKIKLKFGKENPKKLTTKRPRCSSTFISAGHPAA